MFKTIKMMTLAATATLALAATSFAHEYKVGDLTIDHPVARATPVNAPVSGGYMTIKNNGDEADRLVSASVKFAGKTEIHEMKMDGDVMKMRKLENGIEIKPGESVQLKPGGFHIMFMKLSEQLKVGEKRALTLTFEKAGSIDVEVNVEDLAKIKEELGGMSMSN